MDPLDKILFEMGEKYQERHFLNDIYDQVSKKIKERRVLISERSVLGISLSVIILIITLALTSFIFDLNRFGEFFSIYFHVSYSLVMMMLIVVGIINSQKFLTKIIGSSILKKINSHNCNFIIGR